MRIWAISDLHLSFFSNKPMDVFGVHWYDHATKIKSNWDALVSEKDVVLCPGDLSWAMRLEEALIDLQWIGERPGIKVFTKGNHDYWWNSLSKLKKSLPANCFALQNDALDLQELIVAGTRLWDTPDHFNFTSEDRKIYEREIIRLELALKKAKQIAQNRPIIAAVHYPPHSSKQKATPFTALLEKYEVKICVYGHLHDSSSHKMAIQGEKNKVIYYLVACDYLNFKPKLIWPIDNKND